VNLGQGDDSAKEKKYFDISSEKVACLWMGNEVAM